MRVLVPFKIVADLDLLRGKKWTITNNRPEDPAFVKKIINPYDESALELALKLADNCNKHGLETELHALTIDKKQADLFLKKLIATGYNLASRFDCAVDLQFNPSAKAALIAAYLEKFGPFDLIIMGMQSSDEDNAKTPYLTAEETGWPCISGITGFNGCETGSIRVFSVNDQGTIEQTIHPPYILAVGNAPNAYLRIPTLKAIKTAAEKEIKIINLETFNITPDQLNTKVDPDLIDLVAVDNSRKSLLIEGPSAEEKVSLLYDKYLKGRLSSL